MTTIGIALYYLFDILSWIIVIKSFMTWLPNGGGRLYDILSAITEPIESPIRSIMYKYISGPVDFSPMIAILLLMLLKNLALRILI